MKRIVKLILTSVMLWGALNVGYHAQANVKIDANYQNPQNKKVFKSITLPNKMEVLLVSDPNFNVSSAALDVYVGSLANPKEHLGIAHYLEHLLFIGTKKYPNLNEYIKFIEKHQGRWNAYTSNEHTNYHFEIGNDAFEECAERLSRFFIDPLFDKRYVEKELNAVDSEHKKNIDIDSRRFFNVLKDVIKEGHPLKEFATGSRETLKNTKVEDVIKFYEDHYSANTMKLVLMSPKPINEMERIAKSYFSEVKNRNLKPQEYSNDFFDDTKLPTMVKMIPLKDTKNLSLAFELPKSMHLWKSKPVSIISNLLGYEGEGSLYSQLKREGLATGISSSEWAQSFGTFYFADFDLTDKGVKNYERVIELFFSYMKLLNKEGYKQYIFEEQKAISEINFVTREHYEGFSVASSFANSLHEIPAKDFEKNLYLLQEYDPKNYKMFIDYIKPEKMVAILMAQGLETNLKEKYYGADYAIGGFDKEKVKQWNKVEIDKNFAYPKPNQYISKELTLLSGKGKAPELIINKAWGEVYYQFDSQFNTPKTNISLTLLNPVVNSNPKNKILTSLYIDVLNKSLEEWKYPLTEAGMYYSVGSSEYGIELTFGGYSEKLPAMVDSVLHKLKSFEVSEQMLEDIKSKTKESILNSYKEDAYKQARYQLNYLVNPMMIHQKLIYDPANKIDLISDVKANDLQAVANKIYSQIAFKGAVYGNIERETVISMMASVPKILKSKLLPVDKRPEEIRSRIPEGKQLVNVMNSDINNNALFKFIDVPDLSLKSQAILKIGESYLSPDFFTNLRTKQQLGYIVFHGNSKRKKSQGIVFVIQSSDYDPQTIDTRVSEWMKEVPAKLQSISDKEFEGFKLAVATKLKNPPINQAEAMGKILEDYFSDDMASYNYSSKIAAEVLKVTKKEVVEFYSQYMISEKRSSLAIHFNKKGNKVDTKVSQSIEKPDVFRKELKPF